MWPLVKRAVILAGGEGTRLRPYTTVLPKPLMPIGDRPVLDIVVRQLKAHRFERITIATGYLAELIEAFFRDGEQYEIPIDYYREAEPLGTVGALALIDGLADDDILVMNGDVLTDIDYGALLEQHKASDAAATIATKTRDVQISLGVLRFADEGDPTKLTGYDEKTQIIPSSAPDASTCSMPASELKRMPIAITVPSPLPSSMVMTMAVIALPSFGCPFSSTSASRSSR